MWAAGWVVWIVTPGREEEEGAGESEKSVSYTGPTQVLCPAKGFPEGAGVWRV